MDFSARSFIIHEKCGFLKDTEVPGSTTSPVFFQNGTVSEIFPAVCT